MYFPAKSRTKTCVETTFLGWNVFVSLHLFFASNHFKALLLRICYSKVNRAIKQFVMQNDYKLAYFKLLFCYKGFNCKQTKGQALG